MKSSNPYAAPESDAAKVASVSGLLMRSVLTIIGLMVLLGIAGGLLGMLMGFAIPEYYRTMFPLAAERSSFSPVQVGLGLGATQGAGVGLLIGCVSVLAVSFLRTRGIRLSAGDQFGNK